MSENDIEKIGKLKSLEFEFVNWLDNVNYSGSTMQLFGDSIYYKLIEGFKNGKPYNVSFDAKQYFKDSVIIIRAQFPRGEQRFTIEQFYEWMKKPNRVSFLQQF